jgi:hypothetical protein
MKSLSLFLRAASQQFSVLTQRLMLALHVKRTAQLGAVLVLSLFVAVFITHSLRTASAQQKKWTSDRAVLVVTSPLDEGDELTTQNTRSFNIPLAITPDDALENFAVGDTARFSLQPQYGVNSVHGLFGARNRGRSRWVAHCGATHRHAVSPAATARLS